MGGGARIRFWHDIGCGEAALKNDFPSLFRIARDQEAAMLFYFFKQHNGT